jgi:hypothetical protein
MGDSAHTAHHTNPEKKSALPFFHIDQNFFQKSAFVVLSRIQFWIVPRRPIFEKSSHLREKGGVLMLFKTTPHLGAKAQYKQIHPVICGQMRNGENTQILYFKRGSAPEGGIFRG